MGKNMIKNGIIILLALAVLGGCSRPAPELEVPKSVPANTQKDNTYQDVETEPEEDQTDANTGGDSSSGIQSKPSTEPIKTKAQVESTANERSWSTTDDVLARQVYDLIHAQNEIFTSPLDIRAHDYVATITEEDNSKRAYKMWINFIKENEIIIEDEEGKQWNLSVWDSNLLRSILRSLN